MAGEPAYRAQRPAGRTSTAAALGVVGPAERYLGPARARRRSTASRSRATPTRSALGGPLVDERGAVVGVTTAVEDGGTWYVAPVEVVDKVADDLLSEGYVHHAWLGIEGTEPTDDGSATDAAGGDAGRRRPPAAPDRRRWPAMPAPRRRDRGARVDGTIVASMLDVRWPRGRAAPGDVIVAIDGRPVVRMPDLTLGLRSRSPGDRVDLTVARSDVAHHPRPSRSTSPLSRP